MRSFRSYDARIKHDVIIPVHQFIEEGHEGLVVTPPSAFIPPNLALQRFTELEAYYLAFAIKHRQFLAQHSGHGKNNYALTALLWFLANDAVELVHAREFNPPKPKTFGAGSVSLEDAFKYYMSQDFWICLHLTEYISAQLSGLRPYLESPPMGAFYVVNSTGEQKLRQEHPRIVQEIGIADPAA